MSVTHRESEPPKDPASRADPPQPITGPPRPPDSLPGAQATAGRRIGQPAPPAGRRGPGESSSHDPECTGGGSTPAGENGRRDDGTWSVEEADAFDDVGFWNNDSCSFAGTAERPRESVSSANTHGTSSPSRSGCIEDIWGSDFDGLTPNSTLKGPRGPKPPPLGSFTTTLCEVPKNLSLEGYELLKVLGEGGVGVVYQAVQKSIDRQIAVKMIKPAVGADPREKAKFISEALVTGELDHPNIVPIYDLGATRDDQPFYTMKMVRGTPWEEVIASNSLAENLRILLDTCDAVSFAHSKGVIHRDLKPENVMLGEFGEVQVMDWGLGASVAEGGKTAPITQSRAAGGTPAYMAPEMVTGEDNPVGIHSDIYLLGAILYQIVTGKPPHAGHRVLDCLQNAAQNIVQPTDQTGPLVDIALHAMQTRPADRHPSVRAFKQAIVDYQAHAESINLSERASDDLRRAVTARDYESFARALFGFHEALRLWRENAEAHAGVAETHLQYARCAYEKGDLDLAASLLDPQRAAQRELWATITEAQHRRRIARRRLKLLRATAVSLTAVVIVILTVAAIWISAAKRQAVMAKESAVAAKHRALAAKEAAVTAQRAEAEQRVLAVSAMAKAQEEEARAVKALADLEQAVQAMIEARTREEQALAQARASELVASQTRDQLAKTGMLLDNSWWVYDAETAKRRQLEAADAIGMPVCLTIALPADANLDLVLIPPGEFVMGSPPAEEARSADEYLHRVRHGRPFYLGKFEVTEEQWQAVTGRVPPNVRGRDPDPALPLTGASFEQITEEFLPALQKYAPEGYLFRLSSEAEWEYACRAGTGTAYYSGQSEDALDAAGWFLFNSNRKVHRVGAKSPNAFGLYDMHGNVGEICADQYAAGFYLESPTDDPIDSRAGERPVVRGGSVLNVPAHCRAAYRSYVYSKNQYEFLGLRLSLVPARVD